ncbi:histidine kinase/DNA gyrase B/HSP90-like ATPase [Humitalea rosea]|uniref:histidine kinase n=1 Tax=Humitalea rosea TaxID=990373 RepID=A0A2W7IGE5_9PROT|nr:ATP-binding protein [Humitalea rosea]PZW45621.1 histidine kinase/DNA gyrase B/HSP90-like ATPase [Humitalea rosea]
MRDAQSRLAALTRCLSLLTDELQAPARQLLLGPSDASAHARRLFDLADEANDRLALQAGARVLREEALRLGPLAAEVLATVEGSSRCWRIDPLLRDMTLRADPRALRAVIRAVVQRALREAAAEDVIALRLVTSPEVVALVVEGEGAGSPVADLDAATAQAAGTRGLGLGLATARDLMRAHGGDLVLESAAGIGTRAWLTLPRWRVVGSDGAQPAAAAA